MAQELARRLQGHRLDSLESPIAKGARGGTFSEWRRLRHTIELPIGDHVGDAADLLRRFQAEALDYVIVGGASHFETLHHSHLAHALGLGGWSQTVAYGPVPLWACTWRLHAPFNSTLRHGRPHRLGAFLGHEEFVSKRAASSSPTGRVWATPSTVTASSAI